MVYADDQKGCDPFDTGKHHYTAITEITMCWGALLCDAGNLTRCVKLCMTFEGSRTEKQWPP